MSSEKWRSPETRITLFWRSFSRALKASKLFGRNSPAAKIGKAEAWLDWSQPAAALERRIRAFDPFPVASTVLGGTPVRLWRAMVVPLANSVAPGTVVAAGTESVTIACGQRALRVTELQRAGGKRLPAREFLAGFQVRVGEQCASPV